MIAIMPRPRPPYLHRERTRHGAIVWYVRIDKGPRIRIRGDYGSPELKAAYDAAISGQTLPQKTRAPPTHSLAWLIDRYRDSGAWARLSGATRRQRENIFLHVIETAGDEPFAKITRKTIAAAMDRRKETSFAAIDFLKSMRGLFRWAFESGHVESDPTEGVRGLGPKTEGFHCWTDAEIECFEARWPIGTRERLALALLLFTGLRRGDVVKLGRQHVKDGVITFRTEKTKTPVVIPLLPELAAIIDASKTGDLTFICGQGGRPMVKESFGTWFRLACKEAGVPGRAHGLRKAGATRAANNGATVAQLEAIFGWRGGQMAALYTRQADRTRLAKEAMEKLRRR